MLRPNDLLVWAAVALSPLAAVAQQPAETTPEPTAKDDAGANALVDSRADQRVRAMSDFLAKQKNFRFSVEITYDAVEPDGQKVQLGRRSRVEVSRPSKLRAESQGDRGSNLVSVFDGEQFLLHDQANQLFSRVKAPATLDEFFEFVFEEYGTSPPLVDFLMRDIYGAMTESAETTAHLGKAFVAEQQCEQIAFTGELLDWQLWIQDGEHPFPRKFVITYKDVDVRPQFMAVFREWQTDVTPDAKHFDTSAPNGATAVPMERFVGQQSNDTSGEAPDADVENAKDGE